MRYYNTNNKTNYKITFTPMNYLEYYYEEYRIHI